MMMLLVSLPALSVACDISTEKQISQLKKLLTKDPLVLANNALKNNHVVFFGVAGYSVTIPGIDTEKCNIEKFPTYIIPGTTDVMCSNEHRQLILDAKSLAAKYNSAIQAGLEKQSLLKCSGDKASNK
jgi:hypothetical protein